MSCVRLVVNGEFERCVKASGYRRFESTTSGGKLIILYSY
jgi:hypothetical protein